MKLGIDEYWSKRIVNIVGVILFLAISIYVLQLAASDKKSLSSNAYMYLFGTVVPLLFIFYFLIGGELQKQFIYIFTGIIAIIILLYLSFSIKLNNGVGYIVNIVVFLIVFIGFMLMATILSDTLKRKDNWIGFTMNFIFYLPCLVNDFIAFILIDFYSTPQIFLTLFIIEILLILYFIYAMPAIQNYIKGDGVPIQSDPVFLNQSTTLNTSAVMAMTTNTITVNIDICGNKIYTDNASANPTNVRSNFSISMWTYVNPPNSSRIPVNSEANIFYYGSTIVPLKSGNNNYLTNQTQQSLNGLTPSGTSFHPQITYAIDELHNGFYKIYADSNIIDNMDLPKYITIDTDTLPYQKWNNIVLNYNQNMVDIFINGNLVRSVHLTQQPLFSNYDIMAIGTDSSSLYETSYPHYDPDIDGPTPQPTVSSVINTTSRNGLYGSVCNVVYYPTPLDRGKIRNNYNYLMVKNPPIY